MFRKKKLATSTSCHLILHLHTCIYPYPYFYFHNSTLSILKVQACLQLLCVKGFSPSCYSRTPFDLFLCVFQSSHVSGNATQWWHVDLDFTGQLCFRINIALPWQTTVTFKRQTFSLHPPDLSLNISRRLSLLVALANGLTVHLLRPSNTRCRFPHQYPNNTAGTHLLRRKT